MGEGGPAAELHVAVEPDLPAEEPGAGGVHHVAFRIPDADYAGNKLTCLTSSQLHRAA